ncbi:MAG: malonyl-ACP O-methyltransferase BioC [Chlorobiaceae bacterium]|nr:malonyl-ACP O-methyltransferase BioC [Chlorobiaceae bacterium]
MHGMIDKKLVRERFRKSLSTYAEHAVVQNAMASELSDMICRSCVERSFGRVFEVGSGTGALTGELLKRCRVGSYFANDLVDESHAYLKKVFERFPVGEFGFIDGDIESGGAMPDGLDLVLSNATLQWLEDFEGFLLKARRSLNPGGMLAFSTFGPLNMHEISAVGQTGLAYRSLETIERLAGRYFESCECREEQVKMEFSSPEAVLRHIRATGVNGISRRYWTKSRYLDFLDSYRERFSSRDGVSLTYHPIYCCLKTTYS